MSGRDSPSTYGGARHALYSGGSKDAPYDAKDDKESQHAASYAQANYARYEDTGSKRSRAVAQDGEEKVQQHGSTFAAASRAMHRVRRSSPPKSRADPEDGDFEESSKNPASFANKNLHTDNKPRRSPRGHDPDFRYMVEKRVGHGSVKYHRATLSDLVPSRPEPGDGDEDGRSVKYRRRADNGEFDEQDDEEDDC